MNMTPIGRIRVRRVTSWMIGGVALMVLFIYILYSGISWRSIITSSDTSSIVYKKMNTILTVPSVTLEEKRNVLTKLDEIHKYITSQSLQCNPSYLIAWQGIIFTELRQQEAICYQTSEKLARLQSSLANLTAYLRVDEAISKLVTQANQELTSGDSDDRVKKQADVWSSLRKNLDDASINQSHTVAVNTIRQIDGSWQLLVAAHNDKNQLRFESARQDLLRSYESLQQARDSDIQELSGYLEQLKQAYEAILP